jgi:hypothetical protein
MRPSWGSETAGFVPMIRGAGSSPPRRSGKSASPVSGAVVWDCQRFDVPKSRELFDVGVVLPVTEAGQVAVGAGLTCVLSGRLAVHLENAGTGLPDHAANQVDVVHLARRRSRLIGLVDALEHHREERVGLTEDLRGGPNLFLRNTTELCGPLGWITRDDGLQVFEPDRVLGDPLLVGPPVRDQLVYPTRPAGRTRVRTSLAQGFAIRSRTTF